MNAFEQHGEAGAHIRPRKRPRQERARETVRAILAAAAEQFARHGYAGATTNRIARRAGVSIGSLYQYFPNKDALLAALMERHHREIHAAVERSTGELADPAIPVEEALRSLLVRLAEVHDTDPDLARALTNTNFHQRKQPGDYAARIEAILRGRPDVRAGDRELMALVLVEAVEALTRWLVHEAPGRLDRGALIDEIVRLLAGYLQDNFLHRG